MPISQIAYEIFVRIITTCARPFLFLHPRGKIRQDERYGHWTSPSDETAEYQWFHGASAGEIRGLIPIIREFKAKFPDRVILLTSFSPTGLDISIPEVGEKFLIPFDSNHFFSKAIGKRNLKLFIAGETELWPGLYRFLAERRCPSYLVNARISDMTFPRYRRFQFIFSSALSYISKILTADKVSAVRFNDLGVAAQKIEVTGNAKYDTEPSIDTHEEALRLKDEFFPTSKPVIVLGSLRPGEEEPWLECLLIPKMRESFSLIVAPRHAEKFDYFYKAFTEAGINLVKWSQSERDTRGTLLLLDTFGILEKVYSFADIAFIGGSIIPHIGGHNPLEACAYKVPVCMGPHHSNVKEVVVDLQREGAISILRSKGDIEELLNTFLHTPEIVKERGKRGYELWRTHRGATYRIVQSILAS